MSLSSLHPTTTFHNVEEPPVLKPTLIPRSVQYWLISRLAAQRHAAICHTSPHESVNKDRLYIGLYARGGDSVMSGGEDKYHWALIIGPKNEHAQSKGKRFHVKEAVDNVDGCTRTRWVYEERDIGMNPTAMILVRVVIGKVASLDRVMAVLRGVPVRDGQPGWNCVWWVREALEMLRLEGEGALSRTSVTGWDEVRGAAMGYVERKMREHRFDGGAPPGLFDMDRVATYDLLQMGEIIA